MSEDLKGWLWDSLAVVSCLYVVCTAVRALLTFI